MDRNVESCAASSAAAVRLRGALVIWTRRVVAVVSSLGAVAATLALLNLDSTSSTRLTSAQRATPTTSTTAKPVPDIALVGASTTTIAPLPVDIAARARPRQASASSQKSPVVDVAGVSSERAAGGAGNSGHGPDADAGPDAGRGAGVDLPRDITLAGPTHQIAHVASLGCRILLHSSPPGRMTRQVTRSDGPGGVVSMQITVLSKRAAASNLLHDCSFADLDGDARLDANETVVSYRNEGAVFAAAERGSRFTFQVTLDAAPTSRICGRSMRVARTGRFYLERSKLVCMENPPPVVPESASAVLLPLSGAAVVGVAIGSAAWRKRRKRGRGGDVGPTR